MRSVSHYELLEKLGEGGMGVVWKARDTRLDRFVAIKFLPPDKTADPDRKMRFAQEARAASALNHPRIITIYDIDHADGSDFIAMEYVAGKTLDQLIPAKGMKVADAVRYAMQIADALAAAHAAGIVHRDLKPANVIVSHTGQVKVLDFGLAKLQESSASGEFENTRTIVEQAKTEEGTIVGTAYYMSPEQAEGRKVDARSDIFSFGSVLYEMLTGKRAFHGETKVATLAAILRADPAPVEKQVDGVPRELARIVQRCLRKDPDERAQSMADLRIALKEIKEESESGLLTATAPAAKKRPLGQWIAAGIAAIAAGGIAAYLLTSGKSVPETPLQTTLLTSYQGLEAHPSFSPDASQVAFSWNGEQQDNEDIYVKLVGAGKPLRLTTDPARDNSPSWSPDGRWIAFVRNQSVLLISPLGGPEREVARDLRVVPLAGMLTRRSIVSWSPDGRWLVATGREKTQEPSALWLVSPESGERHRLTTPPAGINGDSDCVISPDGRTLVFTRVAALGTLMMSDADIYTVELGPNYSPKGAPVRMTTDHVLTMGITWTADSREIVFSSLKGGISSLWRMAVSGDRRARRVTVGDNGISPTISRAGNRLAYEQSVPSDSNIWRIDLSDPAKAPTALISSTRQDQSAQYSPDGKKIVFSSERSGPSAIWVCDADGGNAAQISSTANSGSPAWSPDGERIAFDSVVNGQWQVFTVASRGGQARQLTTGASHTRPRWSSDGQWIYASSGGGIVKVSGNDGKEARLTADGGSTPAASPDGKTVYYFKAPTIWQVDTDGSGARQAVEGEVSVQGMDVTADGIYYVSPAPDHGLRFFSFQTGKSSLVRKLDRRSALGVSVSPDRKWLIYCQVDTEATGDLILVDPFR